MAIIRPDGLIVVEVDIEFNLKSYSKLEIDLAHINYGIKQTRATFFSVDEIKMVVTEFLDGEVLELIEQKHYGDDYCDYYIITKIFK